MVGYRNAVYVPQNGTVRTFTWNEKGERVVNEVAYKPYLMLEDNSGKDESIFNTRLRKRFFNTQFDRSKFARECGTHRIFENLAPVQQYLVDQYWQSNNDEDFSRFPIRVITLDIEVYSPDEFPKADLANHPINIITFHDTLTEKFYSWGTSPYIHDRTDLEYVYCRDEKTLLRKFIDKFRSMECDLLTGWNSAGFDIPYIINRISKLLGEEDVRLLSPVGRVYNRMLTGLFGTQQIRWYIDGVSCVDYIDIYKRFSFANRENYKLDFIAELELGEKKVDYGNTNLAGLSVDNWQLFVDYNLQDVALLVKMDKKLQYIALLRMLSYMGLTTMENAMSTLSTITGTACIRARQRNQYAPTFLRGEAEGKNPGAYVAEPLEGFQKDVVSFDANSLYPNIMISLNMSPETKIGCIIDTDEKIVKIRHVNGQVFELTHEKFAKFKAQEKIAVSKADVLFTQKKKGILPDIVDTYYKERVAVRKEMMSLKKLKDASRAVQDKITQLNAKQLCIKIFINSVYGYMGNKNAPLGDDDVAASITLTGQYIIKSARTFARQYVSNVFGHDEFKDIAVAGDTDSIYVCITPLLEKHGILLLDAARKVNKSVHTIIEELNEYMNTEINEKMRKELNSHDPRIVFKREAIIDKGLFLEKKRYVAHVVDDEGIEVDKWKYVGVEVVRTSMPKAIKPYVKRIIETMMETQDRITTNTVINEAYDVFKSLKPEEVAFVMGIKDYDKHARHAKEFTLPKGAPIHVSSAHNYNILLDKLGLGSKYEKINSGDKIRWMYITTPNKFGIKSIAFKYYYPTEFNELFQPAYEKLFEKIIFSVVERFYAAVKWPAHKPTEQLKSDLFDLFG